MKNSKISVIMTVFNVERYLLQAVYSVLNQTHGNVELIIVDDCSTDGTPCLLKQISDVRVKVFTNERNRGPSYSRNLAIRMSTGDFVAILDGDDYFALNRLAILLDRVKDEDSCFVADNMIVFADDELTPGGDSIFSQQGIQIVQGAEKSFSMAEYFEGGTPNIQILVSSKVIKENRIEYDEEIVFGEDLKFLIQLFSFGLTLKLVGLDGYFYRKNPNSITRSSRKPWEHLAKVHNLAAQVFAEKNEMLLAKKERDISQKYFAFSYIKRKRFFALLKMILENPYSLILMYRGVAETISLRRKQAGKASLEKSA